MEKHLMDIVPYRLGSRVRVVRSHRNAADWPDVYVVTGLRWEYHIGPWVNIELADDRDIENGSPAADGFRVEDLEPAEQVHLKVEAEVALTQAFGN